MAKKILYQDNARRALERGMEIMVEAVSVTLGPKGRNVVLEKTYGSPQIVNDGVTIAREIKLEDHIENTGVSLIRQAAAKTNDVAGDGTTTNLFSNVDWKNCRFSKSFSFYYALFTKRRK